MNFGRANNDVMFNESLDLEARGLYAIITCLCGPKGSCYPKISTLMKLTGRSRSHVCRLLRSLRQAGVIVRTKDARRNLTVTVNLKDEKNPLHAAA